MTTGRQTQDGRWRERARLVTPGGSQTRSKAPPTDTNSPAFLVRGSGATVEDVDGRRFIDWNNGLGVLTLGHAHPHVTSAIERRLRDGSLFSLPHPLEVTVAERWRQAVPCAMRDGMVRWVKTGSEACAAAVRIARVVTQRDSVLIAEGGYHGWHDWSVAAYAETSGVPAGIRSLARTFRFNDEDDFDRALADANPAHVAAVIVEPMRDVWPDDGFLSHLRTRTRQTGACLVFDEVVLGLRLAVAGGQEYFGVVPDLAVYGKALGGGLPLACVVGAPDLMRHARFVSSTFGGETLALAAAAAVLDVYEREPVIERIWSAGQALESALTAALDGLPLAIGGSPVRLVLTEQDRRHEGRLRAALRAACAARGVLLNPAAVYPSAACDASLLDTSLAAVSDACAAVRRDWRDGRLACP